MSEQTVTVNQRYTVAPGDDKTLKLHVDGIPVLCYRNQVPYVEIDQFNNQKVSKVYCGQQCAKFKFGAPRDNKGQEQPGMWASSNCGQFPLFYKIEGTDTEKKSSILSAV